MQNEILVELHVPDFDTVKDFYGALGFEIVREDPTSSPGGGYLVMKRQGSFLCFWPGNDYLYDQTYFRRFPKDTKRGFGVEIVIATRNVDELYEKAQALGNVIEPLKLQSWGLRDFRVADPFGYYLRFTEPQDVQTPSPS